MDHSDLDVRDYESLTSIWKQQLCDKGYHSCWTPEGLMYARAAEGYDPNQDAKPLYEAWCEATGTPADLNIK